MTVRIVVADDHPWLRETVVEMLTLEPCFVVVGEAGDGEEAVAVVERARPDLLILDVAMPKSNGIAVARRLLRDHHRLKILMLSKYADPHIVRGAVEAGASGYVLKQRAAEDLVPAVHAAREDRPFFSSGLRGRGA